MKVSAWPRFSVGFGVLRVSSFAMGVRERHAAAGLKRMPGNTVDITVSKAIVRLRQWNFDLSDVFETWKTAETCSFGRKVLNFRRRLS